jgi:hypothetical protein
LSKATKPAYCSKPSTSSRKIFPPQLLQVEQRHGRVEWRGIQLIAVTPEQMGFPHVLQLARLDRIRQLSPGRQEVETVWIITSLSPEQADAARLLELARQYWSIENGTHYRLDVSSGEDRCRVRHPVASTVLGILRRAVQGEYRAWARRQRKARDSTCPAFQEQMSRRINLIIRYLTGEVSRL